MRIILSFLLLFIVRSEYVGHGFDRNVSNVITAKNFTEKVLSEHYDKTIR